MTASTPSPWVWAPPGPRRLERPVSLLHFSGPDALRVLHGQTSQMLQDARPGHWRSTCCLSPTARLRGLAEVVVEDNGAWLALTAGDGPAVRTAFDRVLFPADQVELGPLLAGRWIRLVGQPPTSPGGWRPLEGGGGWWLGSDLLLAADTPLPQTLADVPPLGEDEASLWRLQQGEPAWPEEINDAFNPFELGLADRVSLNKGCYVGQETLAKLASTDGVKQQLRRWQAAPWPEAPQALAVGHLLQTADGTRAGQITSCLQLADASWVGLAMVRRQALESSTLGVVVDTAVVPVSLSRPAAFRDPP
ncbi:MAG: folate-binding protein [Cyanobacteriota bacterium]|nr:folate-binding protein [Cyanobacteriota bacterium]